MSPGQTGHRPHPATPHQERCPLSGGHKESPLQKCLVPWVVRTVSEDSLPPSRLSLQGPFGEGSPTGRPRGQGGWGPRDAANGHPRFPQSRLRGRVKGRGTKASTGSARPLGLPTNAQLGTGRSVSVCARVRKPSPPTPGLTRGRTALAAPSQGGELGEEGAVLAAPSLALCPSAVGTVSYCSS